MGVLSPILFNIKIDELLKRFEQLAVVHQCFMGALDYADGITLLTPTKLAFGQMLKEATSFFDEYNFKFNLQKCQQLTVFGQKGMLNDSSNFNNVIIVSKENAT